MRRIPVKIFTIILLTTAVFPWVSHAGVRVGIGVGFAPYYGPAGYYYPGGYYYAPYAYAPGYYYAQPPVAYAPQAPQQAPAEYWYYCPPAKAYYPYVRQCPSGWQAVPAQHEVQQSKAPPASTPAPEGKKTYSLGDVLFDSGKSELLPAATSALDALVAAAKKSPDGQIKIEGYTDSKGDETYNRQLSQRRADAVRDYLVAHGISPSRIQTSGNGEASPVATNATAEGRQQNRRVDVTLS